MSELSVLVLAEHLTGWGTSRRQDDWIAYWLVQAIKGESMETLRGTDRHEGLVLSAANNNAVEWAGKFAAPSWGLEQDPAIFVPIPSSQADVDAPRAGPATEIAAAIASHWPGDAQVQDRLRWVKPHASTRAGGTREPDELEPLYRWTGKPIRSAPVILVDDVLTQGGHLLAAARFLRGQDAVVRSAVAVAQAVHQRDANHAIGRRVRELPF